MCTCTRTARLGDRTKTTGTQTQRHLHTDERSTALAAPPVTLKGERRACTQRTAPSPPPYSIQWGWGRGEGVRAIVCVAVLLTDPSLPLGRAGSSEGAALHRNMATANWGLERQKEKQTKGARGGGGEKQKGDCKRKGLSAEISAQSASDNSCNRRFSPGLKTALDVRQGGGTSQLQTRNLQLSQRFFFFQCLATRRCLLTCAVGGKSRLSRDRVSKQRLNWPRIYTHTLTHTNTHAGKVIEERRADPFRALRTPPPADTRGGLFPPLTLSAISPADPVGSASAHPAPLGEIKKKRKRKHPPVRSCPSVEGRDGHAEGLQRAGRQTRSFPGIY